MSDSILLVSDTMIKERTVIHGNIDPKLLYPDIRAAQDLYIEKLLGTALFKKLQTIISDGTISSDAANVNYKLLLDKYMVDTLMYYTLSELPTTISYQFWNKGMVRKSGDNTELPSMSELIDISNKYKNRAEQYAKRAIMYLMASTTLFPEYLNPGNTIDTVFPDRRAYDIGIDLGHHYDQCRDNPGGFTGAGYNK